METIQVSLGTVAAWFGKTAAELGKTLFVENEQGEMSPLEQSKIDEELNSMYQSRLKNFETTVRSEGHKRGLKETAEKVESRLKELGIEFENWSDGIEKLSKLEKVQVKDITVEDIKKHQEYQNLKNLLQQEREEHLKTKNSFIQEKTSEKVKSYFKNFLKNSSFDIPDGETPEEKAIRENWENLFIEKASSSANWKIDDSGNLIPTDESGNPLEVDYKPVSATSLAEKVASSMFRKLDGKPRGQAPSSMTKIVIDGDKPLQIARPKNDEEFITTLNELKNNKNVPIDAIEQFVQEYQNN